MRRLVWALLISGLAAGCGDYNNQPLQEDLAFLMAIPAKTALEVRVADASPREEETAVWSSKFAAQSRAVLGDLAVWYLFTRLISDRINQSVFGALDLIDLISSFPASHREQDRRIWGPWWSNQAPQTDWRFVMTRVPEVGTFEISLQVRDVASREELGKHEGWQLCFDGNVEPTQGSVRRGSGLVTAQAGICSQFENTGEQGMARFDFDTSPDGDNPEGKTQLEIVFTDFVSKDMLDRRPDPRPLNATYRYLERGDRSGEFIFDIWTDLDDGQNPERTADEHVEFIAQWQGDGAGRGDSRWTQGDLGGLVLQIQECWDTGHRRVYYQDSFDLAPEEGDVLDCVLDPAVF